MFTYTKQILTNVGRILFPLIFQTRNTIPLTITFLKKQFQYKIKKNPSLAI